MTIVLDHTIVRARDKGRSARFFADLLGLDVGEPSGPFAPVRVNTDVNWPSAAIFIPRRKSRTIHSPSPTSRKRESNMNPSSTIRRRKKVAQLNVDKWHVQV